MFHLIVRFGESSNALIISTKLSIITKQDLNILLQGIKVKFNKLVN